jgi:1,4-dihydroxy-2-naphthoyl-CoA synthase
MRDQALILAQMRKEEAIFRERLKTDEAREAFAAFFERRPPDFSKFAL